jgi:glucose-6-phosphate dehydrogenase assembly protein OpcA
MVTQSAPLVSLQAPKDVSLSQIETELSQIWQMYNDASGQDGTQIGAMRAATFTLVVYEPEETQQLLGALGFYRGPIDGIQGPQTEAAIRSAQKRYGLTVDGHPSPALLARLRNAASGHAQLDGSSVSLYAESSSASAMADAIASQNPCRIISLFPHAEEDGGVTAQVSAYCPIQKRTQSTLICCEYISLKGTEVALERVSSLVASLLISELPKFLWWKGAPEINLPLFRSVGSLCNVVVVDSCRFSEPQTELLQLWNLAREGIQVSDLNWSRLAAWQELAAEAYDAPQRRAALKEVDQVTIDFEKGNSAQAFMFLGWLASRLQWRPIAYRHEPGDYDCHFIELATTDNRKVMAELAGAPTAAIGHVVGDLIGLRLASTNLAADCCTILCSETTGCMRLESGGGAQNCKVQQVSALADQQAELLLSQQLQRWGRDLLYEESMDLTAEILQLASS